MKRTVTAATAAAFIAGVTGCGAAGAQPTVPAPSVRIAADLPPSPATWPTYPHFSQHSCAGQLVPAGNRPGEQQFAPSYAPAPRAHRTRPTELVRRFLSRFGDRRYVRSITFPVDINGRPASTEEVGAVIRGPRASDTSTKPDDMLTRGIANWEVALTFGALRDDFCAAGGPSLTSAGSDTGGATGGATADELNALGQRFPNPSPAAFRHRIALVGKGFGFRVVSLRLLHPEQLAPLLIVKTNRPRQAFSRDVPKIESLLDPMNRGAATFEGFFFAAEDSGGPFLFTERVLRGEVEGGDWAVSEDLYPFGSDAASSTAGG